MKRPVMRYFFSFLLDYVTNFLKVYKEFFYFGKYLYICLRNHNKSLKTDLFVNLLT